MKKRTWYVLWGVLYSLCAGCGFIPEPAGALRWLLTVLAVVCFVPPAALLRRAFLEKDRNTAALVRNLAAVSLGLTVAALVLNFAFALGSETVGQILHGILVVVSSPMVCSGYWALSLFLWACLLTAGRSVLKKMP